MRKLHIVAVLQFAILIGCGPMESVMEKDLPATIQFWEKNNHLCNDDLNRFMENGDLSDLDLYDEEGNPKSLEGMSLEAVKNALQNETDSVSSGDYQAQFVILPELKRLRALINHVQIGKTVSVKVRVNFAAGISSHVKPKIYQHITKAFEAWSAPMHSLYPNTKIKPEFSDRSPILIINVHNNTGRSSYWPFIPIVSEVPGINWYLQPVTETVYEHSYSSIQHELGHAFGLGDAYVEGKWTCQQGQPAISVMCDSPVLTADDIRAVKWLLCRHTGKCNSQNYEDMYGGSGGTFKTTECNLISQSTTSVNGLVKSVTVRWGSYVDSITIGCADTYTGKKFSLPRIGGSGGSSSRTFSCSGSAFLTGAKLRTGRYVDSVEFLCSDGKTSGAMGGNGGQSWTYKCPKEYPYLKGIRTRSGSLVDKIGLTCANSVGLYFNFEDYDFPGKPGL